MNTIKHHPKVCSGQSRVSRLVASRDSYRQFRNGFSLLELMIVLVILMGALAIVWPNLSKPLQRSSLNEAAHLVRSVLDDARYQAMVSGQFWFIRFEKESDRIEYGRFLDFVDNGQSSMFAGLAENSASRSVQTFEATSSATSSAHVPRRCQLPSHIIVAEVVAGEDGSTLAFSQNHHDQPSDPYASVLRSEDVSAPGNFSSAVSAESGVWCIPVLSRGLGQDTAIRLTDTKLDQSITVVFSAATGAIEIF